MVYPMAELCDALPKYPVHINKSSLFMSPYPLDCIPIFITFKDYVPIRKSSVM